MDASELAIFSDAQLLLLFREGQEAAFTELFERQHARVHAFLHRMPGNATEAEDLLQEVFCRVARAARTYEPRARFTTWLHRIAHNVFLTHRKSVVRLTVVGLAGAEPESREAGPAEVASDRDLERRFHAHVAGLPENLRAAFVLRELSGFSEAEVGDMLDIPRGTVRTHVHRARLALRRKLAPHLRPEPRGGKKGSRSVREGDRGGGDRGHAPESIPGDDGKRGVTPFFPGGRGGGDE